MEDCPTKFVDFLDCCLGRRKKEETIELTPQSNTYGQKLMETLDNKGRRNGAKPAKADISKPLPMNPPGRASLDLGKARRPSADLSDLVGSDGEDTPAPHNYDRAWYEMLSSLHSALKHTRYSISGRMGMSVWGCANGAKTGLSVVCPIESREAVRIWCISTSGRFSITEAEPDILTFQSPGTPQSPSRTWRIRIRWLREATFEAMPKVEMALRYDDGNPYAGEQVAEVNVLTLPALLDNCAGAWADHLRRHGEDDSRLRGIEDDVFSILERIMDLNFAEEGTGPLTEYECRHVTRTAFWTPFTKKHPDSPAMFALCGLPMPQPKPIATTQPGPNADMVYSADGRFTNPRPAPPPPVPPKDNGRDLTSNVKRKPEAEAEPAPRRRVSFMDLFNSPGRKDAKAAHAERERRHTEDARRLEEEVRRGARRLDERESERRSRREGQTTSRHGKGKESESRRREGGSSKDSPRLKEAPSRPKEHRDRDHHRRDSTPRSSVSSSSRRPSSRSSSARDGTKVSAFDPSALERTASGNGRIPRRGHFADLFIEDDGEAL
ncbi:hypothetical protein INS49_003065 [Diaporthe citri]|uniref:uncharacterized protein n=1 Tax=Diaporthe citri TaxID=83186 RepID=UPI001C7E1FF9|nr:uncharacterized protein INS49_003065 [Diaporthe citri]KAG6368849.1 hypothetical protein INS49_003065 [Diaporthe citri]